VSALTQLHGKEPSFTNFLDVDAALRVLGEFEEPWRGHHQARESVRRRLRQRGGARLLEAFATDPLSPFGGIVGLNRVCDADTAAAIGDTFSGDHGPEFTGDALEMPPRASTSGAAECVRRRWNPSAGAAAILPPSISAGCAAGSWRRRWTDRSLSDRVATDNPVADNPEAFRVVTRRAPTPGEARALRRAWAIVRHIKSNAILLADGTGTVGIGCGQTSRIDSVVQAVEKARRGVGIGEGTVLASDAFFPFRDSIDAAHAAGITALIHPGGSLRDTETVAAADEQGMAMVLTGRRSFLH
jgi:phosphoribosylaminoimidazolecarboxamide formyltransferase/IMP cyclohydrolase